MNLIKRLVIFSILMENDGGIYTKSPKYIKEKFDLTYNVLYPVELLHPSIRHKFEEWDKKWGGSF